MNATEKARADAQSAAQRTLQRAATFAELHATSKPLFQKPMRLGSRSVLVRIVWPGVLVVCDPGTGEVLAQLKVDGAAGLCSGGETGTRYLRLWPHIHHTDGFFAAIWVKKI